MTAGAGSVLLAGAQVGNESQDSSGFEMSFRDDLLGGGGGGGLSAVSHHGTLVGNGTAGTPLGVNPAAVVTSLNTLHGAVTLSAGSNVTITPSGPTLTIAASGGGGGGLTLPFSGTASVPAGAAFKVQNPGTDGAALWGTGTGAGVYGESTGGNGVIGTSSSSWGVHGVSSGTGVNGAAIRAEGNGIGLYATNTGGDATVVATNSTSGIVYKGFSNGGTEVFEVNADGVNGFSAAAGKAGVYGSNGATLGYGVWGNHDGAGGAGVYGASSGGIGVAAQSGSTSYATIDARKTAGGVALFATTAGVSASYSAIYGENTGSGYAIFASGSFGGTGAKYFVEPHATDPTKEIRYVCLEGRESGTYFRGPGRIVNGFATIAVPEDFRMVTSTDGLTAVVTPVGGLAVLAIVHQDLERVVVQGSSDVGFNYVVNGVRKVFQHFQPVSENVDFLPKSPNDTRLAAGLPAESVRRLKATGILNADGSVNLETAHRLGWDKQPGWRDAARR